MYLSLENLISASGDAELCCWWMMFWLHGSVGGCGAGAHSGKGTTLKIFNTRQILKINNKKIKKEGSVGTCWAGALPIGLKVFITRRICLDSCLWGFRWKAIFVTEHWEPTQQETLVNSNYHCKDQHHLVNRLSAVDICHWQNWQILSGKTPRLFITWICVAQRINALHNGLCWYFRWSI